MHKNIDTPLCFEVHVGLKESLWLMDHVFINTQVTPEAGEHEKVARKNMTSTQNLKDFFSFNFRNYIKDRLL